MTTTTRRPPTKFNAIFQWRSLKTRVTTSTLIIFLVGIWSLTFYSSYTLHNDMEQALGEQQFSTVSIMAADINNEIDDRLRALETVAARITPAILGKASSMQAFLEDRIALETMFNAGVNVTRLDGIVIADVPISMGRIGINYSERNHVAGALKGKTTIGNPVMGKMVKAPIVPIAVPILDKGNVIGTLTGITNLGVQNFLSKITDHSYGKTGGYLLVSPKIRTIVYATDKKRIMEVLPGPGINPLIDRFIQGYDGSGIVVNPVNVEVLASAKGIPLSGWYLAALMPTEEAFAPAHALRKRMLLTTIFLTMLACGLTWWILKRQLAPIFTTIKTLATLSDTDRPPQPLPITRQDEIGELIGSFNHLLETLEQRGKALQASEEQYRILFEGINDAVFVHDMDEEGLPCRFLQVNDVACRRLGYTREELLSLTPQDITNPEEYERIADKRIRLTSQRDILVETVHVTKDGQKIPVESNICKFQYDGRRVVLSISRDITKRRKTEEMLKDQLLFLQQLLDAIPIPIFYKDRQGIFRGCNIAYEEYLGLTKEQVVGKTVFGLAPQDLANIYFQADEALFAQRGTQVYETSFLHADGNRHDIIFNKATYVGVDGCVAGLVGVILDISERRQAEAEKRSLEERLNRAEKMEALGQLAGGVAHDLNNVLGVSTIYSELLQEKIPEESPLRKYVDNIFASTQKGAAIIEDLLTLARRGVAASEVINLNSIVSNFLKAPEFEKIQAFHPNVTFRTECHDDLLNIKGSPIHLEKTLMNLVSNAAEAISGKGEATIRIENRYLDTPVRGYDEVKQGDYVVLTVSDTGMGIPAENRNKIFEPFYTKKTMGRSGTGLGLAIVWGTVKDHNGYIDLQTEVGEGTTFTLYFPVTRQELIARPQKAPIERYMGNGESVLVVDDIAEQWDIASRLLAQLGYEVHAVSGGEEAVEYLKEHTADILVLDMIMTPGMDGLETYRRVLEINPRQKAILVSGFSETDRVRKAQELGAGAYVKKPYVMEKIGVAMRDELDKKIDNGIPISSNDYH